MEDGKRKRKRREKDKAKEKEKKKLFKKSYASIFSIKT